MFDRELTPAQARELDKATSLKVLDRTQVILDIFAQNAKGRQAQVQVELAQLQYQLPRLPAAARRCPGSAAASARAGPARPSSRSTAGASAPASPRSRRRSTRSPSAAPRPARAAPQGPVPVIALVGYTNAGKSTLFNALAKSDVLARDALFATLRPTTRGAGCRAWAPGAAR